MTPSVTHEINICQLYYRMVFARFGLPEQIATENGPRFVTEEFQELTKANGIRHTTVAPYPKSNGLAERFVQIFKASMKKMADESSSLNKLANFLLTYHQVSTITIDDHGSTCYAVNVKDT